jgi:hypothetical protein
MMWIKLPVLLPLLRSTQRIRRSDIQRYKKVDWGNARSPSTWQKTPWTKGGGSCCGCPRHYPYYKSAGVFSQFDGQGNNQAPDFLQLGCGAFCHCLAAELRGRAVHQYSPPIASRILVRLAAAFRPRLQYRLEEGTTYLDDDVATCFGRIRPWRVLRIRWMRRERPPNHVIDVGVVGRLGQKTGS